ncbi:hypothetical protein LWI28_005878 [Acer negundo]|uniref:Mechanosensitive ion channel MscS domain-containing protein n=1 Tax=Acer negundo TaxID=4023 RepID=A0AAD5J369_ACENE|nr:hypothetical protein LWI28_005878 [Acer negundo]
MKRPSPEFLSTSPASVPLPTSSRAMAFGMEGSDGMTKVHAYVERKALAHSLNDTKTAVQQLHKLASAVVIVVIIVVSLLVLGLATTNVVFLFTSQLLVAGFMFQNTCKTIFESIIFVFVMHPFDVGDRCVIDGVQMIVEEMNILTTVFLRYDMEKIYYPNSVLITKAISNFRRSPEMGDSVEFTIDVSTPVDDINAMKKAIQTRRRYEIQRRVTRQPGSGPGGDTYMQLGDTYSILGHVDWLIGCYEEGLKIQIEALGDTGPRVGETCRWQGPGGWHWCWSQE